MGGCGQKWLWHTNDKYGILLSEQLSKLFPEVEDGSGGGYLEQEDDQKIIELPIPELTEN